MFFHLLQLLLLVLLLLLLLLFFFLLRNHLFVNQKPFQVMLWSKLGFDSRVNKRSRKINWFCFETLFRLKMSLGQEFANLRDLLTNNMSDQILSKVKPMLFFVYYWCIYKTNLTTYLITWLLILNNRWPADGLGEWSYMSNNLFGKVDSSQLFRAIESSI